MISKEKRIGMDVKAQKSFIHEKWQGRESKIRTISRGTVLFLGETINKRKRKEPLHNVPSDGFEAVSLSFHSYLIHTR